MTNFDKFELGPNLEKLEHMVTGEKVKVENISIMAKRTDG